MQKLELNGYSHYWGHIGLVKEIVSGIPTTDIGLPSSIYRFDLLDLDQIKVLKEERDVSRSIPAPAPSSHDVEDTSQSILLGILDGSPNPVHSSSKEQDHQETSLSLPHSSAVFRHN